MRRTFGTLHAPGSTRRTVRAGLHTGECELHGDDVAGVVSSRDARPLAKLAWLVRESYSRARITGVGELLYAQDPAVA
jgi:hypothetical protein